MSEELDYLGKLLQQRQCANYGHRRLKVLEHIHDVPPNTQVMKSTHGSIVTRTTFGRIVDRSRID